MAGYWPGSLLHVYGLRLCFGLNTIKKELGHLDRTSLVSNPYIFSQSWPISLAELRSPWPAVGKRDLWEHPSQACAIACHRCKLRLRSEPDNQNSIISYCADEGERSSENEIESWLALRSTRWAILFLEDFWNQSRKFCRNNHVAGSLAETKNSHTKQHHRHRWNRAIAWQKQPAERLPLRPDIAGQGLWWE